MMQYTSLKLLLVKFFIIYCNWPIFICSWSSISIVFKVVWILNIWDMYHKQHIISAKSNGTEVHYSRVECQVARVKYRSYFSFSSDQPNNYVISLGNLASGLGWRYFISILSTFKTKL